MITFTYRRVTTPFVRFNTNKLVLSNKWIFIWSIWRITTISYYFIVFKYFLVAIGVFSILNFLRWLTQNLLKRKKKKRTWKTKGKGKGLNSISKVLWIAFNKFITIWLLYASCESTIHLEEAFYEKIYYPKLKLLIYKWISRIKLIFLKSWNIYMRYIHLPVRPN